MTHDTDTLQERLTRLEQLVHGQHTLRRKTLFGAVVGLVVGAAAATYATPVPHIFQPDQPARAHEVNENFEYLSNAYPFRYRGNALDVVAGPTYVVNYVSAPSSYVYDPESVVDAATGLFTAPVTGDYFLSFIGNARYGSVADVNTVVGFVINGAGPVNAEGTFMVPGSPTVGNLVLNGVVHLDAGDTVSVGMYATGGASFSVTTSSFSGFKL